MHGELTLSRLKVDYYKLWQLTHIGEQSKCVRERFKSKKRKEKLINFSFRYVRVAENFENLVFFPFCPYTNLRLATYRGKKGKKLVFTGRRYV